MSKEGDESFIAITAGLCGANSQQDLLLQVFVIDDWMQAPAGLTLAKLQRGLLRASPSVLRAYLSPLAQSRCGTALASSLGYMICAALCWLLVYLGGESARVYVCWSVAAICLVIKLVFAVLRCQRKRRR